MMCQNPDCDTSPVVYVWDDAFKEWFPVCQYHFETDYPEAFTRALLDA
jgi:hypothetical protein